MTPGIFVGLGGNVGRRGWYLRRGIAGIRRISGTEMVRVSSVYETEPVGHLPQEPFLNAACEVRTALAPDDFLEALQGIEAELGRDRGREVRWGPRKIDLDLLLWGNSVIETPFLAIPHPRLAERAFALAPLAEIAPEAVHPVLARSVRELLSACDRSGVRTWV